MRAKQDVWTCDNGECRRTLTVHEMDPAARRELLGWINVGTVGDPAAHRHACSRACAVDVLDQLAHWTAPTPGVASPSAQGVRT